MHKENCLTKTGHLSYSPDMIKEFTLSEREVINKVCKKKGLTKTEIIVFTETIAGKNNQEISENLFVNEKCIRWHLTNIYKKTKATKRSQLIWVLDKFFKFS